MKITIYNKENDENIYFKINDEESSEKKLNFEALKNLSTEFLEFKKTGIGTDYTIECNNAFDLYKTTLDNVLKSVIEDEELYTLYNEKEEQTEETNDEDDIEK